MKKILLPILVANVIQVAGLSLSAVAAPKEISLWTGTAPGETAPLPPEVDVTKPTDRQPGGRPVVRISNVSHPTITIFAPEPSRNTGAAVLVCPGGAYARVAIDLEGSEVCEWLNSIGVTGVLLKYRVPRREGVPQHVPPVQDAQRALGIVRHQAKELGIDPQRIGVLGFSAGAHVAAVLSNNHDERIYPIIDDADRESCRPDFAVLVYPGYLAGKDEFTIAPELPVSATTTPPTILIQTEDDSARVENALFYYAALKRAGVSAELHLYPVGDHGSGLRHSENLVCTWPDRVADWMKASGWLKSGS